MDPSQRCHNAYNVASTLATLSSALDPVPWDSLGHRRHSRNMWDLETIRAHARVATILTNLHVAHVWSSPATITLAPLDLVEAAVLPLEMVSTLAITLPSGEQEEIRDCRDRLFIYRFINTFPPSPPTEIRTLALTSSPLCRMYAMISVFKIWTALRRPPAAPNRPAHSRRKVGAASLHRSLSLSFTHSLG